MESTICWQKEGAVLEVPSALQVSRASHKADGGSSERAAEFTLPTCLVCSLKQSRKPLSNKATTIQGFTENMVVIWKDATTAVTISLSHSQPMGNSIICLPFSKKKKKAA